MSKKTLTPANPPTCRFPFSDGRHCKMPVAATHSYLCLFHAERERRIAAQTEPALGSDALVAELLSLSREIKTASDLNRVLTRLWTLVLARRIDRLTAANLAYIASLILQTLSGVKSEIYQVQGYEEWERTIRRTFAQPQPAPEPTQQP